MSATGPNTGMPSNSCPMSDLSSSRKAATLPNIFLRLMSEAMEMPANPAPIMYKCLSDLFTVFNYSTAVRVLQFDNAGGVRERPYERSERKTTVLRSEEGVANDRMNGRACASGFVSESKIARSAKDAAIGLSQRLILFRQPVSVTTCTLREGLYGLPSVKDCRRFERHEGRYLCCAYKRRRDRHA